MRENGGDLPTAARMGRRFITTRWTVVLRACRETEPGATEALETLCRAYWYPVYDFVRQRGHSGADAEDLAQEFFTQLIHEGKLRQVDPGKGRFRSFLRASLRNFLINQWQREQARKRGGGGRMDSLDAAEAETPPDLADTSGADDARFDRHWAVAIMDGALARLREEQDRAGRGDWFELLKPFLSTDGSRVRYARIAAAVNSTPETVRVAVHRLRRRYGECVRAEVEQTVEGAEEVAEEMGYLMRVLAEST